MMTETNLSPAPAPAFLASSLVNLDLQQPLEDSWIWDTGIKPFDHSFSRVITPGKVIGILGFDSNPLLSNLISRFASRALVKSHNDTSTISTSVYIIAPANPTVIGNIHEFILSSLASVSSSASKTDLLDEALDLMDTIQLLQYFDFAGLAEALSEVASRIFEQSQQGHNEAVKANDRQKDILIIQGLDTTLASTKRRSGLVQTNALLSNLLRTITHLARTYRQLLVIVELGVELRDGRAEGDAAEVVSAFASDTARKISVTPGGTVGRNLEAGMDLMILIHNAWGKVDTGKQIAEVVKDRTGSGLGIWTVCKTNE